MKIEQFYTKCLSEASYYIESNGEVAIIDPLRDVSQYIEQAKKNNAKIKYVLETHFHADFVSGHVELSKKTDSTIVFGPSAKPNYKAKVAEDGEILTLGDVSIKVLHTPGHTLESACYLLLDEAGREHAVFTGDTLFVGEVGRPDLVQKLRREITPQYLAGLLFDSLHNKLMTLPDDVIVYPGHGAGSACGKNIGKETASTIGNQRQFNYALSPTLTKTEFIENLVVGLDSPPSYFPANVILNITGELKSLDEVLQAGNIALSVDQFEKIRKDQNAMILDTRETDEFAKGFIPGSISIGIGGSFAPWVGTLIPELKQPLLLVVENGREEEVITRLARVGYDNPLGFLQGGIPSWTKAGKKIDSLKEITAEEYFEVEYSPNTTLLDVRRESEFKIGHIENAENVPLDYINENIKSLDFNREYFVHCAGGYRSVVMCSILKSNGFNKIVNILGGYSSLSAVASRQSKVS